jgi:PAS domain S-box-containing protein
MDFSSDAINSLLFKQIFNTTILGLSFGKYDGSIVHANQAFLDMLGYTYEDLKAGKLNWKNLTPPEYAQITLDVNQQLRATGHSTSVEKEYFKKDGSRIHVVMGIIGVPNHTECDAMAFVVDITTRKNIERELALAKENLEVRVRERTKDLIEANSFLDSLIEQIPNMIFVKEAKELRFVRFNKAGEDLLGISRNQMIGKNDYDFFPKEQADFFIQKDREVLAGSKAVDIPEEPITTQSGDIRILHTKKIPVFDENYKTKYLVGISEDITEKKKAEEQSLKLIKAQAANRMKDEFLATLSHELRTPLNVIVGFSEILKNYHDELKPEELKEYLQAIYKNAISQTHIVNDLLDISRIITGKILLNPILVSCSEVLDYVVKNSQLGAELKNIEMHLDVPNSLFVFVDVTRFQQIIENLISNAIKFTPAGGTIWIRCYAQDSQCIIEVKDTGIGIDSEFLPFIFEKFRQEDSTMARRFGGLGLGLSIVRHLVELHQGSVHVSSEGKNKGSAFTVKIPLMQKKEIFKDEITKSDFLKDKKIDGVKVLLVDDSSDNRKLTSIILRRQGAEIQEASSAKEAREVLKTFSPNIILCDIGMPEENGVEFLEKLRRQKNQTPAIALTAFARDEERDKFLMAGFQAHISKPISSDLLIKEIQTLLKA